MQVISKQRSLNEAIALMEKEFLSSDSLKKRAEKTSHILLCNCNDGRVTPQLFSSINGVLPEMPVTVTKVTDLCGVVSQKRDQLSLSLAGKTDCLVIGCYRRTLDLLLQQTKIQGDIQPDYKYINLLESTESEVISQIEDFCRGSGNLASVDEISHDVQWSSWYPLIDYSRCTSCGQCADFCLFGVYEKSDTGIKVINPERCKTNCPACARICPSAAIIFPKYKNGGAVGGSDEINEEAEHARMKGDIERLLGDNIYEALKNRKLKRASIIKDEEMKKALVERDLALNKRDS